jgi:membrane protein YdbS with pleckstrin-like domain
MTGDWNSNMNSLDPRQKTVMRIRTALFGLVPLVALLIADGVIAEKLKWPYGYVSVVAAALYAMAVLVMPGRRYRRWGYRVEQEAIRIVSGLLIRKETVVPFARVQHIDVTRGPIERSFGVAVLTMHTAGSYNSTVALPGLAEANANALRDEIRSHIKQDQF